MIVFAGISPHPPLLVPEIGKEDSKKVSATLDGLTRLGRELAAAEPDTIIVVSPHMVHYPHLFNICGMEDLYGSFNNFDFNNFEWHGHNNLELAEEIADKAEDEGLPAILYNNGDSEYEIDHGVMVPLYFLNQESDFPAKILPISYSFASRSEHYTFGQVISEVCQKKSSERIAIIASGDLSHRLHEKAGGLIANSGMEFDSEIIKSIKKADEYSIVNMDEKIVDNSGECGYRSILILLGALSGSDYRPEVYSYESPFGVGYMVANMGVPPR